MPEDISGALFYTYLFTCSAIIQTFLVVNLNDVILQADDLGRADLNAHFAGDTPDSTYLPDLLARIFGAAGNSHPGPQRQKLDDTLGTGADTIPAAHTTFDIHCWKIVLYGDGVKGAALNTVP